MMPNVLGSLSFNPIVYSFSLDFGRWKNRLRKQNRTFQNFVMWIRKIKQMPPIFCTFVKNIEEQLDKYREDWNEKLGEEFMEGIFNDLIDPLVSGELSKLYIKYIGRDRKK